PAPHRAPAPDARRPPARARPVAVRGGATAVGARPRRRRLLGAPLVKRNRVLYLLAGACALLAALLWWDRRRPSTAEQQREGAHVLPMFDRFARAAAPTVEIDRDGTITRLVHDASGWWLAGPPRRRADAAAVESLLSVLEFGQVERRLPTVDAALRAQL